ncbi:Ger(x)C family spore germination protein [Acetivibrio clariflavus]|uniref:Germination protein, Ger(X)C family n=1 Tax=Acetivibrio clariflavus (strain DSM 19732 / NBRC 101661 / EBR45) TaxID=720554 RepID=G8M1D1_ACECE|nr:Ger(x)C family spore germination protein [Acetivibrio clariflavus]AEV68107.1 germination protein, Ger(X)C family [Acetivibrio clariflavus DSM 19732]
MAVKYRIFAFILIVILQCIILTGCFDKREPDDMAYPIALGFDKGSTNELRMTMQIAVPTNIAGGESGGGGDGESSSTVIAVETPSIYSGLNMLNSFISKQINLSHIKVIVFSQEIAQEGISKYLHAMIRNREFRPNVSIIVSRCSAEEFIDAVKPKLETNPAKYYELLLDAYRYTGFTTDTQLIDFYNKSERSSIQPVAVLADVSKYKSSDEFDLSSSTYKEKGRSFPLEGDFKAGDLPKLGGLNIEIMGLAIFDGGKMVGELDGEETSYNLMVEGKFNSMYFTMPDPIKKDDLVVLQLRRSRLTEKKVEMIGDKPKLIVKVHLEGDILSVQSGINYESGENVKLLQSATEAYIKDGIIKYLDKSTKVFKTDTNGFGNKVKGKFLTWQEWQEFDWLSKYKEATYDVEVDVAIRRPGLIVRTVTEVRSNK